jgi:hypothetical protein
VAALASYIAPHGAKVWYYGAREPYCFVYLVDPRRSPHNVMLSSPLHVAAGTTCLYLLNQVRSFVAKTPTRKKRKKKVEEREIGRQSKLVAGFVDRLHAGSNASRGGRMHRTSGQHYNSHLMNGPHPIQKKLISKHARRLMVC